MDGGRRRRKRKAPAPAIRGAGFRDVARGVGGFVKDNKLISKGLNAAGIPLAGTLAGLFGLGRRRRRRRAPAMRGGAGNSMRF